MSKLLDKLRRLGRSTSPGMGFRPAPAEGVPVLLIPLVWEPGKPLPSHGDALALNLSLALSSPPPQGDIPWGVVSPDLWVGKPPKKEELSRLEESGCDFLVLTATEARALLLEGKLARFLPLDLSKPDSWLRAAAGLGDGGVIALPGMPLTLEQLVQCRRLTGLFAQPVLALAPAGLSAGEAGQLAETGVLGIISPDLISEKKFKQWHEALATRPPRRPSPSVLLPQPSPPPRPERE